MISEKLLSLYKASKCLGRPFISVTRPCVNFCITMKTVTAAAGSSSDGLCTTFYAICSPSELRMVVKCFMSRKKKHCSNNVHTNTRLTFTNVKPLASVPMLRLTVVHSALHITASSHPTIICTEESPVLVAWRHEEAPQWK